MHLRSSNLEPNLWNFVMQARLMDPTQKFMPKGQIQKKPIEEENPDDVFSSFTRAQKVYAQMSKPRKANEE